MKTTGGKSELSQEALAQAADWLVEFRVDDVDATAREEFNAWLRRSPQNVQAYLEIARTYAELPAINPSGVVDAEALIAYARSDANVVSLPSTPAVGPAMLAAPTQRVRRRGGLAIAASLLLAVVGALTWSQFRGDSYSTDFGEQRSITLTDGSTIDLNARTRIRVSMKDDERLVELLDGQALFKVAKDKARPFIVRSDDTQVRAVGTQFDVYRRKSGTTVTVLEGRVAVMHLGESFDEVSSGSARPIEPPAKNSTLLLGAGEQATITPESVPTPVQADVAAAVAWTDRLIIFDGSPLTQVVEEFNRYSRRQLVIRDASLATFHISGVYSSSDPASLLRFLRAQDGIDVVETETEIRISAK
ncbi:FecR family protein [Steroidobacter sp.]|uniref:FecR family protein n=1 Tax=Steroidobacter sp. TaxID=1978227 RepID=UPI001A59724A|nr:FecR domain-containing protein [Steroidobacter sp.]MBL8270568.1 FecR domain-containing protein [Steroidobacter sp.]